MVAVAAGASAGNAAQTELIGYYLWRGRTLLSCFICIQLGVLYFAKWGLRAALGGKNAIELSKGEER